ncbi:protein involved in utilization of DNA as a carbon source [Escherichia coli]|uniref:Protein involved in utilization of DNA as a carbon source n=1 Tax=Escherichia coli TaxID=562 RepID=A0A2X3J9A6_ECOLX|nr:protein involved in utilization of DNA as a carbon source [Escherichia coli]
MNMFFDWWFATSPRLRQLCWAFWLLMLVTLIFLSSTHHEERDALIRLRASHHQQWAALYRLVDTTPLQRGKNAALFASGFSVIRRATGFLASIRAGR